MPHQSFKVIPGVDTNRTPALNEAAISECQLIRFVPDRQGIGLVQKLGGWQKYYPDTFSSTIKALHAWQDNASIQHLAVGMIGAGPYEITNITSNGVQIVVTYNSSNTFNSGQEVRLEGVRPDVYNGHYTVASSTANSVTLTSTITTPYVSGGFVYGGGNALNVVTLNSTQNVTPQTITNNVPVKFETTAGSNAITITDVGSNINSYDAVYIQTDVSVGGIVVKGTYQCEALGANTFRIYATDTLGNPLLAAYSTVSSPVAVTGASGDGTIATLTYSNAYRFFPAEAITVAGVNPSGYNGVGYVSASTTGGTVSYDSGETGTYVSGGTVSNYGVVSQFETTAGSALVTVTLPYHGYQVGDTATFLVSTRVGDVTIFGDYTVLEVISSLQYKISATYQSRNNASAYMNGGKARLFFYKGIGPLPEGTGYGVGAYGEGAYGSSEAPIQTLGVPINAQDWSLDNWGEFLIASPLNGPIYEWSPQFATPLATVIPQAPPISTGMFVAMPQRQIVAYGSTFTGVQDPLLIRWCDVNNYNDWIGTTINQAGSYRIPKGSQIIGGIQGPQQGLLWTDLALWSMQYIGGQFVYSFNEISTGCGLIGQKAAGLLNNRVYWMSQSQFFVLTGSGADPVPCPIWDVIFQDIDMDYVNNIRCAPNSRFGEISWYYPTIGSNGIPTKYVKHNALLGQWDYGTLSRTAWINQTVLGPPIGAGQDNYLYQHEMGQNADTQPMVSYFQTGYFALSEADIKIFIDQIWPDMKWGYYDGLQNVTVNLYFYVTDYAGQTPRVFGPFPMTQQTTFLTPRLRGRLISIRLESTDFDTFWRIGQIRYRLQPDGKF